MDSLTPIPTPRWVAWREFRIRVIPGLVFLAALGVTVALWMNQSEGGGIPGIAEGGRAILTAGQPGRLVQLLVQPYEIVEAGQPLAVFEPLDTRIQMGLLQAEMDLARIRLQPTLAEGNALDYERLRADLLGTKAQMAVAEVRLVRSESEVRRNEPLVREKLVSEDVFELVRKTRDMDRAEVGALSNSVVEIEQRFRSLQSLGEPQSAQAGDPGTAAIARLEALLDGVAARLAPVTLTAPIAGMVNTVFRRSGENVVEDEPLLTVVSLRSERVVGYLRQPYGFDPQPGQKVLVTTRERTRREFWSVIRQLGAQVEIITNALAYVPQGALVDAGLPVVVDVPPEIALRPGEIVDLRIRPSSTETIPEASAARGTMAVLPTASESQGRLP